ncbi:hypothetical protein T1J70_14615 [Lactiplantibacillus plantarum]|uniref:hypothetical protein n=1 Tax=Lactiplantibacillus plantarum TaxID=1590 RepID=UPI002001D445|nr:hypothetical protein [Lactiplantibacillus plantarum]MCK3675289.1 hypothetical protein [Lactiplantibacillus plantarum]WQC49152.1 hypothetical protein TUW04_08520 [Lactiplantibacillus plantarum]WQG55006.1 hypothetical protein T1J70_14615 [Lactiplantibacillus plantarum]
MFKPMASVFTNHQIAGHYRAIERAQKCVVPFHFEIQGQEYPKPKPERNWLRRLSGTSSEKYAMVELTPTKIVLWSPEGRNLGEMPLSAVRRIQIGAIRCHVTEGLDPRHAFRATIFVLTDSGNYYFANSDMEVLPAICKFAHEHQVPVEDPLRLIPLLKVGWRVAAVTLHETYAQLVAHTGYPADKV